MSKRLDRDSIFLSLNTRGRYYSCYTIVFVLISVIIYAIFSAYGKVPIWDGDAISQSFPAYVYSRQWLLDSVQNSVATGGVEAIQWHPSIGFGQDIQNVVSLRPNYIASMFFTRDTMLVYLWVFVFLRLFLTGVSFSEFCFYHKLDKFAVLNGAIAYSFCSYALLFGVRHYFFIDMLFLLPIILLGVEKVISEKKGLLLLISVAFTASIYLYFLYILTVFAIVYFLIRFFTSSNKKTAKIFLGNTGLCFLYAIIGFCFSLIVIYPQLRLSLESSRLGEAAQANRFSDWVFPLRFYVDLIINFMNSKDIYLGLVLGFSGITILCGIYVLLKKHEHISLKVGIILVLFCIFIPFASYILNAFSGNGMRWSFVFAFILSVATAVVMPSMFENPTGAIKGSICFMCLCGAGIIVAFLLGKKTVIDGLIVFIIYILLFVIVKAKNLPYSNSAIRVILLVLLVINVAVNAVDLYVPTKNNFFVDLHNIDEYDDQVFNLPSRHVKSIDDSLYRIDEYTDSFGMSAIHRNYGFRTGTNGVSSYYSMTQGALKSYYNEMGIQNRLTPFFMLNLTHRTGLNTMNSVKYLVSETKDIKQMPYGYELLGSTTDLSIDAEKETFIYENKYFVPYQYIQTHYIERSRYEELNPIDKEQAVLQGVVIENYNGDYAQEIDYQTDLGVLLSTDEIVGQINSYSDSNNVTATTSSIVVREAGSRISLAINSSGDSEVFVVFSGLEYYPQYYERMSGEGVSGIKSRLKKLMYNPPSSSRIIIDDYDTLYLRNELSQYYEGPCDAVGGVGYNENSKKTIELYFKETGVYYFDEMLVIENPVTDYRANAEQIQSRGIESIEIRGNDVISHFTSAEKGILCINIPYARGWTAYVDGVKQDIIVVNTMYMGLEIEDGTHEVRLHYESQGIKEGYLGTLVTCLIMACAMRIKIARKPRKHV